MTQEERELLLIDLCGRLPYGVKCNSNGEPHIQILTGYIPDIEHYNIKPYLRPPSSMTKEEIKHYSDLWATREPYSVGGCQDYLNSIHIDYRGLIPMGLALEAPKGMYKSNIK